MVHAVCDQALKERLLLEIPLSVTKRTSMCKAAEAATTHLKGMSQSTSADVEVSYVKRRPLEKAKLHPPHEKKLVECKFCGLPHQLVKSKCPAWGKKCGLCGDLNHFAKKCHSTGAAKKKVPKTIRYVTHEESSSDSDIVGTIGTVSEFPVERLSS